MAKMLTALVNTRSNSQIFLLKKCKRKSYSLLFAKATHIYLQKLLTSFSAKILAYVPYLMIKVLTIPLRKHAYSNILKMSPPKKENYQIKNPDIFHTSAQNIDCGYSLEPPRRGGSNEYPQFMF